MPMDPVACKLKIGAWEIDTHDDPHTELVRAVVERGMNSPVARFEVALFVTPAAKPGLLEQAIGAAASALGIGGGAASGPPKFSFDVRGSTVAHDDPMEITLAVGDRRAKVMTGTVERVSSHLGLVRVSGRGTLATAARSRVDQVFESQSAGEVARKLASAVGLTAGQIDSGDTYPYLVADSSASAYDHLTRLAELEGMDLYEEGDGALVMRRFTKTGADRKLYFGIHLLDATVRHDVATVSKVQATGEGPASSKGTSSWHHLLKDATPVQSAAGDGTALLMISRAASRSSDAAKRLAKGRLAAALDSATTGTLTLLGDPTLALGDAVEVTDAPWPEVNGTYKVVRLRHRFVKDEGFLTSLGVTGMGGADAAEGLLGQALSAIGGLF